MPYKDPERQKEYLRAHYIERVTFLQNAKSVPCADCKISYPYYVMDFDHVRGEKLGNLTDLRWRRGIKALAEEISKCDVVCSNCHRERTHSRALLSQRQRNSA